MSHDDPEDRIQEHEEFMAHATGLLPAEFHEEGGDEEQILAALRFLKENFDDLRMLQRQRGLRTNAFTKWYTDHAGAAWVTNSWASDTSPALDTDGARFVVDHEGFYYVSRNLTEPGTPPRLRHEESGD